ncbi:helix-turn-helix transcriptional regulator [Burkholderia multivorans]|uniref:Helix-turn-helix transcriptional regulator n=1 Tax=Burkholderia multivorans TaxID=87883 RepID=A0AAP2HN19_9BURK|nr:helix-turn-helix transcriptional regulator [Burkholderia multivorans]MBU9358885.1 helix-turn-helix transcriptional regulator [Burkholderia multivorans]MBU9532840.1 helix-turn-helix transcriptional regulator [Burkholderia multivorans]MBU9679731.1 helix-turn-helix transcriptional regulator [Burkholderia multivorans]MCA7960946.1 helix-turn-helix transcriptional regulator [Burkholderia multivorans]MCO1343431.1 helix-turn-helix transcriptional regulator [Burkholderia multivorans]
MKANLVVTELLSLGLSQMDIAERIGISQSTVSAVKRGVRKRVPYETVVALEGLLDNVRAERAVDAQKRALSGGELA